MGACASSFRDELIQRAVRITLGEKITAPRAARARQTNYQRQPKASIDYPACRLARNDSGVIRVACFHAVAGKHDSAATTCLPLGGESVARGGRIGDV